MFRADWNVVQTRVIELAQIAERSRKCETNAARGHRVLRYAPWRVAFWFRGTKMPNVLIVACSHPGRCPGLWATFGLTARPNHFQNAVLKSAISRQAKVSKLSLVFWLNEIVHKCTTFQGHICNNIRFDTPSFILLSVIRDRDDSLRNFFPSKTFQPFIYCAIDLFISGLPLNGWARQPFIAEGSGPERDLFAGYILLVSLPFVFVFSNDIFTSPQLRGSCTIVVGK